MADPFIGEIRMVGFTYAPKDWANADGQLLQVAEHNALFALYGDLYGGDGRQTFGLPDLRGRVPIHTGRGPGLPDYDMGMRGGTPEVTLGEAQIPAHTHGAEVHASSQTGDQATPLNHYWAVPSRTTPFRADHDVTMNANAVDVESAGGSQPHQNMPPFLTIRFCVSLAGMFPPRN